MLPLPALVVLANLVALALVQNLVPQVAVLVNLVVLALVQNLALVNLVVLALVQNLALQVALERLNSRLKIIVALCGKLIVALCGKTHNGGI